MSMLAHAYFKTSYLNTWKHEDKQSDLPKSPRSRSLRSSLFRPPAIFKGKKENKDKAEISTSPPKEKKSPVPLEQKSTTNKDNDRGTKFLRVEPTIQAKSLRTKDTVVAKSSRSSLLRAPAVYRPQRHRAQRQGVCHTTEEEEEEEAESIYWTPPTTDDTLRSSGDKSESTTGESDQIESDDKSDTESLGSEPMAPQGRRPSILKLKQGSSDAEGKDEQQVRDKSENVEDEQKKGKEDEQNDGEEKKRGRVKFSPKVTMYLMDDMGYFGTAMKDLVTEPRDNREFFSRWMEYKHPNHWNPFAESLRENPPVSPETTAKIIEVKGGD